MSNFAVNLLIAAKYIGRGEFAKADRELKAFAHNVKKHTEFIRASFTAIGVGALAVGTGIVAFASKAIGAYMESETAINKLREAHRAFGEESEANVARASKFATALMRKTNVEDDSIITIMAGLRMQGMMTESLEEGARATIAFMHAGLGQEEAMLRVGKVYQGNFDRLQNLIPELARANTQQEKAGIINAFLARHMKAQQAEVNSLSGAWKAFKIEVGEALEGVGQKLADGGQLQTALVAVKDLVVQISEAFQGWAAGGGVTDAIFGAMEMMEAFRRKAYDVKAILGATTLVGIMTGGTSAESQRAHTEEWARRQKFDKDIIAKRNRANQGSGYGDYNKGAFVGPPDMRPMNIARVIGETEEEYKERMKLADEAAARIKKLDEEIKRDKEEAQRSVDAAAKEALKEREQIEKEIAALKRREEAKNLQRAEEKMRKELRAAEEVARLHVADYMAQQKAKERWVRITKAEDARAARLEGGAGRLTGRITGMQGGSGAGAIGGRITGMGGTRNAADQAFLVAHAAVVAARAAVPKLAGNIKMNQAQRDTLAVDGAKNLEQLLTEQKQVNIALKELLAMR